MTSIHVNELTITYGDTSVIKELDLTIEDGEFFTLLGPSGCGKTTLLRAVAGFITPAKGSIHFDEADVTSVPTHLRKIGMVFQDYALFPNKTVNANVAYGLKAMKTAKNLIPGLVDEALARVGMEGFGERAPAALSGGQRQRVALARALVIRPKVLLMDEPLSNLDTKLRVQIREAIGDLQRELGITTIFVTHDQEEALALSDRIALFNSGRIEQLGTPTEIYQRPRTSYAADFIGAANVLNVEVDADNARGSAEVIEVSLGGMKLRGIRRSELRSSQAFVIARPEHLRLVGKGVEAELGTTALDATVIRQQYLGHRQLHQVSLLDGSHLEISESAASRAYVPGEKVRVLFPQNETLVMSS